MTTGRPCRRAHHLKPILAVLIGLVLGVATDASASPRLVRLIWDVGQRHVYYRVESATKPGHDTFDIPKDRNTATNDTYRFKLFNADDPPFLQKDDRVRLYVVNYNPVAHEWGENSAAEQIALGPSRVGAILNATALAISGAGAFPQSNMLFSALKHGRNLSPTVETDCELTPVSDALHNFAEVAEQLYISVSDLTSGADAKAAVADAKKLGELPTTAELWTEFDDAAAWERIRIAIGYDFDDHYLAFKNSSKAIDDKFTEANRKQLSLDQTIANYRAPSEDCRKKAQALLQRRDNEVGLLKELIGPESVYVDIKTRFKAGEQLWSDYQTKLAKTNWPSEAVELPVKDPIQPDSVLRIEGEFVSTDKDMTDRMHKSLVVEVAPDFPVLLISAGVGVNWLHLKQLQVVKATSTAADGTVSAKDTFTIGEDTSVEKLVPVWIESIRLTTGRRVGLYATFGTTPDRNIFENAIVGGSLYVARWKTVFTAGMLTVRGYEKEDLQSIIDKFSDSSGFVLDSVDASNVPLPSKPRKYSFFVCATFVLAGF